MGALLDLRREELIEVVTWFARGYTIRYIRDQLRRRAADKGRPDLVPTEQHLLTLAVRYSENIEAVRAELAKDALRAGLARKEERIRRISEAAEAIEPQVMAGMNLKATETYRKLLGSIQDEVEPLKLVIVSPDDPWAQLLTKLSETRDSQSTRGEAKSDSPSSTLSTSELEADPPPKKSTPTSTSSSKADTSYPTPDN